MKTYTTQETAVLTIDQITEGIEVFTRVAREAAEIAQLIARRTWECYQWAGTNRPRLVHLGRFSKKARTRKKNIARIAREFFKEGQP